MTGCGAQQDQLPCGPTGSFLGNCQEMETCMVRACHTMTTFPKSSFRAPLMVGDAVSAEKMLYGQHQRVDISAHARTAHERRLQKRLEENLR